MNAVEASGPFAAASIAAMLSGASPFWVNVFASVFITARLVMAFVHIRTENQTLRSISFAAGMLSVLALAAIALGAAVL